ncbi:MBL fold metallo-hydrolase [Candidatus Micrarchaeota archaeon]|nr:MBL fold metallo-hydrolase [Candidatus Micrarchaeota archaeon]
MKITFYGGAGEVGRTCMLLENNGRNVMLDCGIKLGEKTEYPAVDDVKKVQAVTISHAHLDHSGFLPHIYAAGARPKIFATKPTRDLMGILLSDYYRIGVLRGEQKFSSKNVDQVLKDCKILEYDQEAVNGFRIRFYPAGHIMGSAITAVNNIVFSGDICMRKTRVLDPCRRNLEAETLIVESTYGGKNDILPGYRESFGKMVEIINETLDKGGHVIIPSFAVGRAQEVLLALDDYMRSGALRPTKIFMEGMIGKSMKIYRHNAIYANDDIKRRILMSEDDPFKSANFHRSRSKTKEDVLKEPSIIVTTSGMLSGGPVMFYLEKLGSDPKNTLIFVGYQAEGTLGKKVIDGQKKIRIGDREIELKLRIESIRISGHADFNELLQFIRSFKGLKKIFLMHGEKTDLAEYLEEYQVIIPKNLESYDI